MAKEMYTVNIDMDTLHVYDDRVVIERSKGFFGKIYGGVRLGDKTIFYSDMTSIEYEKPRFLFGGSFRFNVIGEEKPLVDPREHGEWDPNKFYFSSKAATEDAEKIVPYMIERLNEVKSAGASHSALSAADEIKKYKELLDMGAITQEEFDIKKKQLLES